MSEEQQLIGRESTGAIVERPKWATKLYLQVLTKDGGFVHEIELDLFKFDFNFYHPSLVFKVLWSDKP